MNLNVVEAVGVEETERFIVEASLLDEDAIPEKSVVQAAPQYTKYVSFDIPLRLFDWSFGRNKLPKSAVGWYKSLKKALTFHKEPSETAQVSDGVAAVLLAQRDVEERLSLSVRGKFVVTPTSVPPKIVDVGPAYAIANLTLANIDFFEINEAFVSQTVDRIEKLGSPYEKVNVHGEQKHLLVEAAHIRALLFEFNPPSDFAVERFLDRLFEHKPESLPAPVAPTREFWLAILISKIDAAIGNVDVIIEWEDDNATIGPIAAKAKESLLRLVHHILPADNEKSSFYRMVSDHGDFGIHMSIKLDNHLLHRFMTGKWDENAAPAMTRIDEDAKEYREECMSWSRQYFKALFHEAAGYEHAIKAGKDVRHFWFALRDW
ncbi:hypothetical protein C0989_008251 [Termitomyces sp. Mn162]|nr:hypothetical protein C0989_008251 [Termitomyces sp. Mn162]